MLPALLRVSPYSLFKNTKLDIGDLMSETTRMLSNQKPAVLKAILRGGALCGVLDISAAFIVYGYLGAKPVPLLQGIASGLLGPRAFDCGLPTALLGLCLHFLIALTATCIYVFLSQWVNLLAHYLYISGPLYGIAVYFFMQFIVIPLSALRKGPFSFKGMIIGVVIHIFCVGLPISLATRRYLHT
jgi:hypothetical protein